MTASLAEPAPSFRPSHPILTTTGLFWAFSYILLTVRGAIFHDDWSRLIAGNRILAVSAGAAAFALVLRRLRGGQRLTLGAVITWIAAATLVIMVVRVTVDQIMFDVPQPIEMHLLWSLSWSGYFGLWVMGAIAFDPSQAAVREIIIAPKPATRQPQALDASRTISSTRSGALPAAAIDNIALLIDAIADQAADLASQDRDALAERVRVLGGYEIAGEDPWARTENVRARFALGLAERLSRN